MEQFEAPLALGETLPGSGYVGAQPLQPQQAPTPQAEAAGAQTPLNTQDPGEQQPPVEARKRNRCV